MKTRMELKNDEMNKEDKKKRRKEEETETGKDGR